FDSIQIIKGAVPRERLRIVMFGGTIGPAGVLIPGAPTFHLGNRYIIFLAGNGSVMFPIVGGQQGIFQVRPNLTTNEPEVFDYSGHALTRLPTAKTAPTDAVSTSASPVSEEAFVAAIRNTLSR